MALKTRIRKWGNSVGVVIPKEELQVKNLHIGDEVFIDVQKKNNLMEVFGSLKDWKIDAQKTKDELRKEWDK